jgi:hypothetical protein
MVHAYAYTQVADSAGLFSIPWQVPTQAPTPLPVSISILSPWQQQSGDVIQVNPSHELRVVGTTTPGLHFFNWTTSNQSLLATPLCMSTVGAYLSIPSGCLLAGKAYLFSLGVDLGSDTGLSKKVSPKLPCHTPSVTIQGSDTRVLQLVIKVNSPPRSGNCTVTPHKGKALSTTFRVACVRWVDEDGNYPLNYQYIAYRRGW